MYVMYLSEELKARRSAEGYCANAKLFSTTASSIGRFDCVHTGSASCFRQCRTNIRRPTRDAARCLPHVNLYEYAI